MRDMDPRVAALLIGLGIFLIAIFEFGLVALVVFLVIRQIRDPYGY